MASWGFVKMHGLSNDFVVVDERDHEPFPVGRVPGICDRHRGIGADGVLVLSEPTSPDARARMTVYNADGSLAEMCGNGLRCVARLLASSGALSVETGAGILRCSILGDGEVEVEMGPATIEGGLDSVVKAGGHTLRATRVRTGNPHLVTFDPVDDERAAAIAPILEHAFAGGTNVELAAVEAGGIRLRVWERGVGFTRACGTGACATVAAACASGRARHGETVRVTLAGGDLGIVVPAGGGSIRMRGSAVRVYEGRIDL
ncbi:MAG: diaminopimelate epimerase [Deltaproteobacteria bacterium]|nr:diaminopimelate epimerase [Deltaproteobacteria bacterium]